MEFDIRGLNDLYYDVKNIKFIYWRTLPLLNAKRFRYLILQYQSIWSIYGLTPEAYSYLKIIV